jgi:hypothetical protein
MMKRKIEVAMERPEMFMAIRKHIETKIESAALEVYPFPHLIIENFFPDDVYKNIVDLNPFKRNAGTEWMRREMSQNVTGRTPYYARKQINFHQEHQEFDAGVESREFWTTIKNCFLSDHWFEQLVVDKYKDYFVLRFGGLVEDIDFLALFRKELFLQRHEPGYYIGPHTDIPTYRLWRDGPLQTNVVGVSLLTAKMWFESRISALIFLAQLVPLPSKGSRRK